MEVSRGTKRKKKSFFQRVKKYARRRHLGRGTDLEQETYEYFARVLEVQRAGFENDEDRKVFVNNVLEQTSDREVEYCSNVLVSKVVETLLPFADDSTLWRFIESFGEDPRIVFTNKFASHVLEKLVAIGADKARDETNDEETREKYKGFVLDLSRFFANNIEEFIADQYANHVGRCCLRALTGKDGVSALCEDARDIVRTLCTRMATWGQLPDLAFSNLPSGFLQALLLSLRIVEKGYKKKLLTRLLDDCFVGAEICGGSEDKNKKWNEDEKKENKKLSDYKEDLPKVFSQVASALLLETALDVGSRKLVTQIYARVFINRLSRFAMAKNANLSVQKLLRVCRHKVEFEAMFDELCPVIESVLVVGNTGVILALAEGCFKHGSKQSELFNALREALGCEKEGEPTELVMRMLRLSKGKPDVQKEENKREMDVSLHGSLTVQTLLQFKKPIKIVKGLLEMETELLVELLSNRRGCHITDVFMKKSEYIGEKSRQKFVKKLQGNYTKLATSKHGSRSFDAVWDASGVKQRTSIAQELLDKESLVMANEFGRIVSYRTMLQDFRHRREEWVRSQTSPDSKKKLFADIIAGIDVKPDK